MTMPISLIQASIKAGQFPEKETENPPNPAEFLRNEPRNLVRLRTLFPTLDQATRGGIPTGIVTSVLGAPHTGKTALVSQIAIRAASEGYLVVGLFKDEGRFAASVRLGQQLELDRARLENQEDAELQQFEQGLYEREIRLPDADSPDWTLERTIEWMDKSKIERPRLLIVDSIQSAYASCAEDKRSLREEIEAKLRLLEGAAKRGMMVMVTSEMNRAAYRHKDPKDNIKGMAAGAESRAIEYVSRLVVSLEGDAELVVTATLEKNSPGGRRPAFKLKFDPATARFREIGDAEAEGIVNQAHSEREGSKRTRIRDGIRAALGKHIELNVRGLEKEVAGRKDAIAEVRDGMVEEGEILERVAGQSKFYRLKDIQ